MSGYLIDKQAYPAVHLEPGLYPVATPIGNLRDITIRALDVLASVDLIACEDTRVTSRLLARYGISKPLLIYHEHVHAKAVGRILEVLGDRGSVALVSDAGTPVISDPGQILVQEVAAAGHKIFPIPGASAVNHALVTSGIAHEPWCFLGFLPSAKQARLNSLDRARTWQCSLVFYESPNRLAVSLKDMADILGPKRQAAVCRELTKLHEETIRGTLGGLAEKFSDIKVKGEIVIVVGLPSEPAELDTDSLLLELMQQMSVSRAAAEAASLTGQSKRMLYQRALELDQSADD